MARGRPAWASVRGPTARPRTAGRLGLPSRAGRPVQSRTHRWRGRAGWTPIRRPAPGPMQARTCSARTLAQRPARRLTPALACSGRTGCRRLAPVTVPAQVCSRPTLGPRSATTLIPAVACSRTALALPLAPRPVTGPACSARTPVRRATGRRGRSPPRRLRTGAAMGLTPGMARGRGRTSSPGGSSLLLTAGRTDRARRGLLRHSPPRVALPPVSLPPVSLPPVSLPRAGRESPERRGSTQAQD